MSPTVPKAPNATLMVGQDIAIAREAFRLRMAAMLVTPLIPIGVRLHRLV